MCIRDRSQGISDALINTAFGILTGALAVISYNYYTNKIDKLTYSLDEVGFSIVQTFAAPHKSVSYTHLKAMGDMVAREKSMMDFLEDNVCITRAEYSRLVHFTARRASRDLQTFIDSGVIRKRGAGRSVVYVKG